MPGLPVALLFPGQGAQYPRMAAGLYGHYAAFTAVMDRAFQLLGDQGPALRADWLSQAPSVRYDDVTQAQPLLYAVNCALGQQVLSWGVEPAVLLGHSVGEMAAATLAGVFGFTTGMTLMRDRMTVFAQTPPGGMLAVAASVDEVGPYLDGSEVAVAAVNAAGGLATRSASSARRYSRRSPARPRGRAPWRPTTPACGPSASCTPRASSSRRTPTPGTTTWVAGRWPSASATG